jgi:hypothetical protein
MTTNAAQHELALGQFIELCLAFCAIGNDSGFSSFIFIFKPAIGRWQTSSYDFFATSFSAGVW